MPLDEVHDLSTLEGRIERGVYDSENDSYITDNIRSRVADYIAKHPQIVYISKVDAESVESRS